MTKHTLYPLKFEPLFKVNVWGGKRLATHLAKPITTQDPVGESWELVDLASDQSLVQNGSLQGHQLQQVIRQWPAALMGPVALDGDRFPLLVKFIDAAQTLSVQVHPDGATAARLGGRPKSEAWYIIAAEPGAQIYLGLQPGTDPQRLQAAVAQGDLAPLLVKVPAQPGMLLPVPPGVVHAIGQGIVLAEVQQPSDTTYRIDDWGRLGLDGKPRQLHLEQALESVRFDRDLEAYRRDYGLDLELFQIRLLDLNAGDEHELSGEGPAVILGLQGAARLVSSSGPLDCPAGEVVLVPHCCRRAALSGLDAARLMVVTFPAKTA